MSLRFGVQMEEQEASQMNALQLAYLGDSVWELLVRYHLINQKYNVHHMHQECVRLVNAHAQAQILSKIQDKLSEAEQDIVRRGRNAHAKHAAPRNQNPDEYAASTGFEALFGYLYLTGKNNRIEALLQYIQEAKENV